MLQFNKQQKEIINNIEGAYLVAAPVGTGKTTVLTERIIKAIEAGIRPNEILCLTFTNRAAEEMRERIKNKLCREDFSEIIINTFHGFCAYFLKSEAKTLGISNDFVIIDDTEQLDILEKLARKYYFEEDFNLKSFPDKIYKSEQHRLYQKIGIIVNKPLILSKTKEDLKKEYQQIIARQNAFDFNQLVIQTLEALYLNKRVQKKWARRFRFIQLDEFQDTHLSEYLVIKELAKIHKNIALIGDLDQTIYGWRDSKPYDIVKLFRQHFAPVKEFNLEINYRFNPSLLLALRSVLTNFNSLTKNLKSHQEGERLDKPITIFRAYNFSEEINWVIENIKNIREKEKKAKIAVLARLHSSIKGAASIFKEKGIAHITIDQYDFFRRQEIKDACAYLKALIGNIDMDVARRLTQRPRRDIGDKTLEIIYKEGAPIGLKISDFLYFNNYRFKEPFEALLSSWKNGRIVVLDTETTGTDVYKDNIVQIYAQEIIDGRPGRSLHYYLKSEIPVGYSEEIHGLSDEFLEKEGRDPKEILKKLREFLGNDIIVGHNVNFDLAMIKENGRRRGINFSFFGWHDTLDISRRFLELENYKLTTIAKSLKLRSASHSADDDVAATVDLLSELIKYLKKDDLKREKLWNKFKKKFIFLAQQLDSWRPLIKKQRPARVLQIVLEESGLKEFYQKDSSSKTRLKSLDTLIKLFQKRDDANESCEVSFNNLIHYISLVRNIDFLGLDQGKIPIVTIHQVKGLEFDYVFLIKMNEKFFPSYKDYNDLEEAKRLFYVALTRARKKIFISYSNFDDFNRPLSPSHFINFIDKKYCQQI